MPMPGKQIVGGELYRYGYQGEFAETDPETGKPAFQLRIYDPRIGRWTSPDPYGQYHSPYMAMGNNGANVVDPDGGCDDGNGNLIPCPDDGTGIPHQLNEITITGKGSGGTGYAGMDWSFYNNLPDWMDYDLKIANLGDYQDMRKSMSDGSKAVAEHPITQLVLMGMTGGIGGSASGLMNVGFKSRFLWGEITIQRVIYTYADDAIAYSIKIHHAKRDVFNFATGKFYRKGQFLPHSMAPAVNFGKSGLNTTYLSNFAQSSALRPWPANVEFVNSFSKQLLPRLAVPVVIDRFNRHVESLKY